MSRQFNCVKAYQPSAEYDWNNLQPKAMRMRKAGISYPDIGTEIGIPPDVIRHRLNRGSKTKKTSREKNAELKVLLAEIPPDKRTYTQRFFGDPIWERSALYRKQQEDT